MLRETKPDILSFVTMPGIRKSYIEAAVKYGVKGILFEKPMATSLKEAKEITDLCHKHKIKAVVCHQHKYFDAFQRIKTCMDNKEIGTVYRISAECQSWPSQIATHYIDYIIWANHGIGVKSLIGQINGSRFLNDSHPSPDYLLAEFEMENGVRADIQCGYFSKPHNNHTDDYHNKKFTIDFFTDSRLTLYGSEGYAYAECNGNWGICSKKTKGRLTTGKDRGYPLAELDAQIEYAKDFAIWMDQDDSIHPCNIDTAFHGYQVLEAIYYSALYHQKVDLPFIDTKEDLLLSIKNKLFNNNLNS